MYEKCADWQNLSDRSLICHVLYFFLRVKTEKEILEGAE